MEVFRVLELVEDFLNKSDNKCFNCKEEFKPYSVNENKLIFECSKCGLKVTLED